MEGPNCNECVTEGTHFLGNTRGRRQTGGRRVASSRIQDNFFPYSSLSYKAIPNLYYAVIYDTNTGIVGYAGNHIQCVVYE